MNDESIIRNHLKNLSLEDIANSVYLYGIDFNSEPIDSIVRSIYTLYEEVTLLEKIVESNFVSETGARLPKDSATRTIIIQDYDMKKDALGKILKNERICDLLTYYRNAYNENNEEKSGPIK